jgi:S-DNA-T family DNA segregation ATPase FtsK/SpoIIIE
MAQNTYKSNTFKKPEKEKKGKSSKTKFSFAFLKDQRFKLAVGFFLMIAGIYLFLALFSYLFTGKADESVVTAGDSLIESGREAENWLGLYGAITSHYFIFRWFGVSAFFIRIYDHDQRRCQRMEFSGRGIWLSACSSL